MAGRVTLLALACFAFGHNTLAHRTLAYVPSSTDHISDIDDVNQENNAKCFPEKVRSDYIMSPLPALAD